ncbi:MAG: alanine--tRNA ligase, partial [Clostridiales bacterium]|nr:alanine--tRNA ligase [Clostridiales bacterium]
GMGLERLAVVMQEVDSVFDVDTMKAIRDKVCELSGKEYQKNDKDDVSIRLVTDHIRSATFMISDGIMPSNEGRGYVLRRIIRRAARHGRMLGISGMFMANLADTVIGECKDGYPELSEKHDFISKVLTQEEEKFSKTIDQGLSILSDLESGMREKNETVLSGKEAFRLYDTFGFPLDLTQEILEEKGFTVDEDGFHEAMEVQRKTARAARKTTNYMGADATVYEQLDPALTTEFVGYDTLEAQGKVTALTTEAEVALALSDGEGGTIVTDVTPFYATMGGQQGDTGKITTDGGEFIVEDTIKLSGGKVGHVGHVASGMIKAGDAVTLSVDAKKRKMTCQNHSATHLLQRALREVLGTHVEQAGSYQDSERTRFDFSHFAAMTDEELAKVEDMVNEKIGEGIAVQTDVMTLEEAKKTGAMALFGEKYGETVRVVSMGDFSKEFCGGTHVKNTADIQTFKIISESGVAAGVRRIEALTGDNVLSYYKKQEQELEAAAAVVKSSPKDLAERLTHMMAEMKALQSENESLKSRAAKDALGDVMDQVKDVGGVKLIATSVKGVDMNGLRELGDQLKTQLGEGVVVIASDCDGKVNLIAMATDGAMERGAHAGNLIKAIAGKVGGGGGGRPNMAQAGGKNPAGITDAIAAVPEALEGMIAG